MLVESLRVFNWAFEDWSRENTLYVLSVYYAHRELFRSVKGSQNLYVFHDQDGEKLFYYGNLEYTLRYESWSDCLVVRFTPNWSIRGRSTNHAVPISFVDVLEAAELL